MENTIISIVSLALLVVGGMTMSQGLITTADSSQTGWAAMGARDAQIVRTQVSTLSTTYNRGASILEITLRNSGQTKLNEFDRWDVIVQYTDSASTYQVKWLPYTSGVLGDNQWNVKGIYLDASGEDAEVFELNILNPGEEVVLQAKLSPVVKASATNMVTVSTPNGVSASAFFSGS